MKKTNKVLLAILDGWGKGKASAKNAIHLAKTPNVDRWYTQYPNANLITFGPEVGLPIGQMGNSEVGHLNIGAGRIVHQDLMRITNAAKTEELAQNKVLIQALTKAKQENKKLHFIGLVSDGGVHSHINHLKALIKIAAGYDIPQILVHAFLDGRDTSPTSGVNYLKDLQGTLNQYGATLSSIIGRFYAMDRDKRWERVKLAYDMLLEGKGNCSNDLIHSLQTAYEDKITDEFIMPTVYSEDGITPFATISPEDVVICFNFRTDRCREITTVLTQQDMEEFEMKTIPLHYVTMTRYDENFKDIPVLFEKDNLVNTLGEVLAQYNKTQLRIAESEKYPHVSFFFSGGREEAFKGESRILIPSPKVKTYDLKPEMSAYEVTQSAIDFIESNQPDFICLNFANPDMVGHTGVLSAAIQAIETIDDCIGKLIEFALENDYQSIVIADHGNADILINEDGSPHTAHTTNLVPCFFIGKDIEGWLIKDGKLGDIAPTILNLLQLPLPKEMTGINLLTAPN